MASAANVSQTFQYPNEDKYLNVQRSAQRKRLFKMFVF